VKPRTELVLSLALALAGCSSGPGSDSANAQQRPPVAAAPQATAAAAQLVAEGSGLKVTRAELEDAVGPENLMDLRQREYEMRRAALDELIARKLFEKEAQSRGLSAAELQDREVTAKTPAPSPTEVERLLAANRGRFGNAPREQIVATIENALRKRDSQRRADAFRRELLKKSGVRILFEAPRYTVSIPTDAPTLGPAKAPVTIVEFADYQCPYCHQAQQSVDEILSRYAGKVRFVHRDFPIDGLHARATPAARASRCAGEQGKFWEYHRGLLTASGDLSDADFKARAQALRLDGAAFAACLALDSKDAAIKESVEAGSKLGVSATPTFFVNGRRMVGSKTVNDFVDVIEDELARLGG
jgi:protein-disulfide isomerase